MFNINILLCFSENTVTSKCFAIWPDLLFIHHSKYRLSLKYFLRQDTYCFWGCDSQEAVKAHHIWIGRPRIQIPALPPTGSMILNKLLNSLSLKFFLFVLHSIVWRLNEIMLCEMLEHSIWHTVSTQNMVLKIVGGDKNLELWHFLIPNSLHFNKSASISLWFTYWYFYWSEMEG